LWSVQVQVTRY